MKIGYKHWCAALLLSAGAHFAVPYAMQKEPETVLEQGNSGGGEILLLGESEFDALAAGSTENQTDAKTTDEEVQPVEPEAQQAERTEDIRPTTDTLEQADATLQDVVEPPETISPTVQSDSTLQPETRTVIEATDVAALSPTTVTEKEIPALVNAPIPKPRPERPRQTAQTPKASPKKKVSTPKAAKVKSGNGGKSNANARKQQAKGAQETTRSSVGNAAVSNYPGKVRRKLLRALRYSKSAARKNRGAQAKVAFTVTSSGQAQSIRILASSGSSDLDKAALDAVRRASPFPPIPSEAGRSQWPFSVPITFR